MFPPEIEEGNIEYKRQIKDLTPEKIIKFRTQMIWRMNEGKKQNGVENAIYYIGIDDDGSVSGTNINNLTISLSNFKNIVESHEAEISSTEIKYTDKGVFAIVYITKLENQLPIKEIKVGLLGESNSGKTTFLGVMTYGIIDDGEGCARENIFRHCHEKQNGTTSSIKYEIVGYKGDQFINYASGFLGSWEYIVTTAEKIINFIDFPGNLKYIKTTLFGLSAHRPDYILIFANLQNKTIPTYFLDICIKLNIPYAIIFTKKDICQNISIIEEIVTKYINCYKIYNNISDLENLDSNIVPIFCISNLSVSDIELIKSFIKKLNIAEKPTINHSECQFIINDICYVNNIGIVVSGINSMATIQIGDQLNIGPINKAFLNTTIKSIHKKQIPCKSLKTNELGSLVINIDSNYKINKNLTIITPGLTKHFISQFGIKLDYSDIEKIKVDQLWKIFCGNVVDCITILNIDKNIVCTEFVDHRIQFIKNGDYIIMKNNNTILIGNIILEH
jgi:GTPase